jgi:hypothetical protein
LQLNRHPVGLDAESLPQLIPRQDWKPRLQEKEKKEEKKHIQRSVLVI